MIFTSFLSIEHEIKPEKCKEMLINFMQNDNFTK